jgi:AraC family transcriptional regulator
MLQPQIVTKSAFNVVGCRRAFISGLSPDANNFIVIPKLWEEFIERMNEITAQAGEESYGIVHARPEAERKHPHEMMYIAGVRVAPGNDAPPGMVLYEVPAGLYAVFTHRGPIANLGKTLAGIYREWLPASGYRHGGTCDVELYDRRFNPTAESSEMETWIPIRPKA